MTTTQSVIDRHDQYMTINYARHPIVMVRGSGVTLIDADAKEYLDLFAGFGGPLLGHCHPELVETLASQAKRLWHVGNLMHTEPQVDLAEAIVKAGWLGRCFFCHSGADANEAAIKLARLYGRATARDGAASRYKVISAAKSFHGRTFGTMKATGQKKVYELFEPLAPGYVHVPYNDYDALKAACDDQTVAVLLEPIQGEGGVNVPDDEYLPRVRRLCDRRDVLLICDEVWTGCGRTGKAFAHQHWNITPDVMTLAKGVGGGLPLGVCCVLEKHAKLFDWHTYGHAVHATTLGGNCIAAAVAAKIWHIIERDDLLRRAAMLGEHILDRLHNAKLPGVKAVRGKGLFVGIELKKDNANDVVKEALDAGLIINAAQGNVIRLAPALIIEKPELDQGLDLLLSLLK